MAPFPNKARFVVIFFKGDAGDGMDASLLQLWLTVARTKQIDKRKQQIDGFLPLVEDAWNCFGRAEVMEMRYMTE